LATLASPQARRDLDRWFYTAIGGLVALITFLGFAPTYYLEGSLPRPTRAPDPSIFLAVHGALFTAWIAFQVSQPWLVQAGRTKLHMRLGIAGAVLALLVWLSGNLVSAQAMNGGYREMGNPRLSTRSPSSPCRRSRRSSGLPCSGDDRARRTNG